VSVVAISSDLGRFTKFLKVFTTWSSKRTLRKSILEIVIKLREYRDMLEETVSRLKARHDELFKSAITAYVKGDKAKSTIYVNELAEIRKIIMNIYTAVLALEKAILRIETIKEISNVNPTLTSVLGILNVLKGQISNVVPEVATGIELLSTEIRNLIVTTSGSVVPQDKISDAMSVEAQKILQEVKEVAEAKLSKSLPQIPDELLKTSNAQNPQSSTIKELATNVTDAVESNAQVQQIDSRRELNRVKDRSLEGKVLEYVIAHGGFIDVADAAKQFNVSKEEILQALRSLKEKNKIIF